MMMCNEFQQTSRGTGSKRLKGDLAVRRHVRILARRRKKRDLSTDTERNLQGGSKGELAVGRPVRRLARRRKQNETCQQTGKDTCKEARKERDWLVGPQEDVQSDVLVAMRLEKENVGVLVRTARLPECMMAAIIHCIKFVYAAYTKYSLDVLRPVNRERSYHRVKQNVLLPQNNNNILCKIQ